MSGNSKTTLAIVFGVVGILLGILGTITAYNAKDAVETDTRTTSEVQALVDQRFQEAQSKQDQLEASQKSEAEKLVAQLTKGEHNLLQKINGNHQSVNKLKKQVKNLKRQNRNLKNQLDSLASRDRQLSNEIAQVENDQTDEFDQLNSRINKTNQQVRKLQRQMANLRGRFG